MGGNISGIKADYRDGTIDFAPQMQTTVAQFITLLTRVMSYSIPEQSGNWYEPYMQAAKTNGVILAGENYSPDAVVRRGDMCKFMLRALEVTPKNGLNNPFKDVDASTEEGKYILTAYSMELLKGFEDGTFRPNSGLNREQMAQVLWTMIKSSMDTDTFAAYTAELERQYMLQPSDFRLKTTADDKDWNQDTAKKYAGQTYLIETYQNTAPAVLNMPSLNGEERATLAALPYEAVGADNQALQEGMGNTWLSEMVRRAKGSQEAWENIDYRFIDKTMLNEIKKYYAPDYRLDGESLDQRVPRYIADLSKYKIIGKAYFKTDTFNVYQDASGKLRVSGILYYKTISNTNPNSKYEIGQIYADYLEVVLNRANSTNEPCVVIQKILKSDVRISNPSADVVAALQ